MFCSKCGKDLTGVQGGFCVNCGTKIADIQPSQKTAEKKGKKFPVRIIIPVAAVLLIGVGVFLFLGKTGNNLANRKYHYQYSEDGLYIIETDGSKRKVTDDYPWRVTIAGNRFYYSNMDDGGSLYTIKTDGSDRRKVNDDKSASIIVAGSRLYYCNEDDGASLYTIKTNGSDRRKVNDEESYPLRVAGNRIYYFDGVEIYSIKTNGSGKRKE